MQLTKGDPVELRLGPDEYVSGEVVDTDYTDIFSDGWTILALVSEGGHPHYGQVGAFGASDVTYAKELA